MNQSSGVGIGGLLLVAFIVLKLCKVIDWSWWWVLAPAWIGLAILTVMCIFLIIVAILKAFWRIQ
jgi:hypothetical protein